MMDEVFDIPFLTVYFDESENSHKLKFSKETGKSNNDSDPYLAEHYIAVFLGVYENERDVIEAEFKRVEELAHALYHVPLDTEFKSKRIKRSNYDYGFASFDEKALKLYTELLKTLNELEIPSLIGFISKHEALVRSLFPEESLSENVVVDSFYANMVRYILRYCDEDFLRVVVNTREWDLEVLREYLIKHLDNTRKNLHNNRDAKRIRRALKQMAILIEDCDLSKEPKSEYGIMYGMAFDWYRCEFRLPIISDSCELVIDGKDKQYPGWMLTGIRHHFVGSEEELCIRMCDLIAGLLSKLTRSLSLSHTLYETSEDFLKSIQDGSGELLDIKWFQLDEYRFNLYKELYRFLSGNETKSPMASSYGDDPLAMMALVGYISRFDDLNSFNRIDPEIHALVFEESAYAMMDQRKRAAIKKHMDKNKMRIRSHLVRGFVSRRKRHDRRMWARINRRLKSR